MSAIKQNNDQDIRIDKSTFDFPGTIDYSAGTFEPGLGLETPREETNPSSRLFGKLLFPYIFNDVSFDFDAVKAGGTIKINWEITVPEGEKIMENNPSSRNFGLFINVRVWLGNDYEKRINN